MNRHRVPVRLFSRQCRFLAFVIVLSWTSIVCAQEAIKKEPVPSEAAQAKAEKVLKELYKSDYAKRRPVDLKALAAKFQLEAANAKDDAATRFVLLRESIDLSAQAGDAAASWRGIEGLAKEFTVDELAMKLVALEVSGQAAATQAANLNVAELALALSEEAVIQDNYEAARKLVTIAESAAPRCKVPQVMRLVAKRGDEVKDAQKEAERLKPIFAKLKDSPDDADANLAAGKFLCIQKGDWKRGLPLLAKGSDASLKALASLELQNPSEATKQAEIGDGWWDLAEAERGSPKAYLLRRAKEWYQRAVPDLAGINKEKTEKRLSEFQKNLSIQRASAARFLPLSLQRGCHLRQQQADV